MLRCTGLAVALLALKGWPVVTENAQFMNKNGGKLFAYTLCVVCATRGICSTAGWLLSCVLCLLTCVHFVRGCAFLCSSLQPLRPQHHPRGRLVVRGHPHDLHVLHRVRTCRRCGAAPGGGGSCVVLRPSCLLRRGVPLSSTPHQATLACVCVDASAIYLPLTFVPSLEVGRDTLLVLRWACD